MKKIFLILAMACGMFVAVHAANNEKPWANGKLQVSQNQRYLQFENGNPFFWLRDTGWLLLERLDRAEAQYYLQKCRAAGFNTVLVQVMDGTPSYNIYGQPSLPFGWDMSKVDPAGTYSYSTMIPRVETSCHVQVCYQRRRRLNMMFWTVLYL